METNLRELFYLPFLAHVKLNLIFSDMKYVCDSIPKCKIKI